MAFYSFTCFPKPRKRGGETCAVYRMSAAGHPLETVEYGVGRGAATSMVAKLNAGLGAVKHKKRMLKNTPAPMKVGDRVVSETGMPGTVLALHFGTFGQGSGPGWIAKVQWHGKHPSVSRYMAKRLALAGLGRTRRLLASARSGLPAAELNILAHAASYGGVSVNDFYPPPKYSARVSKSQLLAWRKFNARAQALVDRGFLQEGLNEHLPTPAGIAFLESQGFVRKGGGSYLKPGARIPKWAV